MPFSAVKLRASVRNNFADIWARVNGQNNFKP